MPVDKDKLRIKLAQLEEYLNRVRELRNEPQASFTKTSLVEAAAERRLYLVIQAAIDVAQVIVSQEGLGEPKTYRDLFTKLGEGGFLEKELVVKLEQMAQLRNLLAHDYGVIDPKRIYEYVRKDIDDLKEFGEQISEKVNLVEDGES